MMFMSLAIHCSNISSVLSWMLILRQEDLMTVSPEIYPFSCLSNHSLNEGNSGARKVQVKATLFKKCKLTLCPVAQYMNRNDAYSS